MEPGNSVSQSIGGSPYRRKLIAVLYADVVGYSRLIGLDDAGTLERLRRLRAGVIDPAIEEHGGRIVQTGGDSLLVAFDSIDGAVRCAVTVQRQVPVHDNDYPPDRAIRFRVGINIGDAIPDGTDLHGDAVNVAARLQAECPPGGICVSRSVRDHMHGRLGLEFEELGPLNLKNIARPVESFLVRSSAAASRPESAERSLVHGTGEALPLPDKPSVAVLPFTNMSGDPEQEYFSDGIAEDIITELSRSRSLFVIARNSSFTFRGRSTSVKQVARDLGVRYVVEGSVRRSGNRIRVVAQLIDAETDNHIWAERYDRPLEDVFAVQDEITTAVVTSIVPAVADAELRRILRKPPESLGAWEAYQRGLWHLEKCNATDVGTAQHLFERAIALDAGFVSAHVALATVFVFHIRVSGALDLGEGTRLLGQHAREAVAIDPSDPEAQALLAWWRAVLGRGEEAVEGLAPALAQNPNSAWANGVYGFILVSLGHRSDGRAALLRAMRLNPRDPSAGLFPGWIATSYYYDGDYNRAVTTAKTVIERYPDYGITYRWLAAALGQLGRSDEAREALKRAVEVSPKSFDLHVSSRVPLFRPEDHEHMLEGLRKAGWRG
jgi:adenylate cyclase